MHKFALLKIRYFVFLFFISTISLGLLGISNQSFDTTDGSDSGIVSSVKQISEVTSSIESTPAKTSKGTKADRKQPPVAKSISHTVKSGDTLYNILNKNGISASDIAKITRSLKRSGITTVLHTREVVDIYIGENDNLEKVFIYGNPKGTVEIAPSGDLFLAEISPLETFTEMVTISSAISNNFYKDALKAGASNSVLKSFVDNFNGIVNFQRDIRRGDKFEIKYEVEKSEDGKIVAYGPVQYGSITVRGKKKQIYRYKKPDGSASYVDESGVSVKRVAFMKPVKATRISSPFGYRTHPVHKTRRMHTGVDYAAPSGTPIVASADGVITFVKNSKSGYGKHIKIKHNATYSTLYGHMSRFAKGMKSGMKVKQGQTIGYVGMTGTATGPHLHHEVIKSGKHIDPLKVTFTEPVKKLNGDDMKRFLAQKTEIDKKFKVS